MLLVIFICQNNIIQCIKITIEMSEENYCVQWHRGDMRMFLYILCARDTYVIQKSSFVVSLFLAFDLCRFCLAIRFFPPRHNDQWPPTSKDFYLRFYPLHFLSYLYSSERASISLFNVECQTWERLWYDVVLDWGLNQSLYS